MTSLTYALDYAKRGWRVLPIKPGEKRPPMASWQNVATIDPETINNWFQSTYVDHGVGIATGPESGLFVIDVDVANGKVGDETLTDLQRQYGQLPDTATVITPSGGQHLYYKYPPNVEIRNDAGKKLGQHLDIRGIGGQCVAPSGDGKYNWDGGEPGEIAEAPAWLIKLLTTQPVPQTVPVAATSGNSDSIAARYNDSTTWNQLLTADGWQLGQTMPDGEQRWVRPGKNAREGISATVAHGGGSQLTVFTSSLEWLPEASYSRFGYYACRQHNGNRSAAATALNKAENQPTDDWFNNLPRLTTPTMPHEEAQPAPENRVELAHLVNWQELWTGEHQDEEWAAYPIIPKGRGVALYAPAKAGKSTILLSIAAAIATNRRVLGQRRAPQINVLYLDYEMTEADLLERLTELGYGPEDDLTHLHYALLPSLPPLDTREGAQAILGLIDTTHAQLALIDTFGRAVEGDEDSADTVRAFYRHTGLALKARGVTYLRTDHSGKDVGKGQRGSSAKNDDVDLVWRLTRTDSKAGEGVRLERTHSRISWVPNEIKIVRTETDAGYTYDIDTDTTPYPDGTAQNMQLLKDAGITANHNSRHAVEVMAGTLTKRLTSTALKMLKESADKRSKIDDYLTTPQPVDNPVMCDETTTHTDMII